jgi:ketosteroid isomerase-like protein
VAGHPNVELLRRTAGAFAARDVAALAELFHDDVVWTIGGKSAIAGEYRGLGEIVALFSRVAELTGGTYRIDPLWFLADDHRGVTLYRATGERAGRSIDMEQVALVALRDGRLAEIVVVPRDQYVFDGFWAD